MHQKREARMLLSHNADQVFSTCSSMHQQQLQANAAVLLSTRTHNFL